MGTFQEDVAARVEQKGGPSMIGRVFGFTILSCLIIAAIMCTIKLGLVLFS